MAEKKEILCREASEELEELERYIQELSTFLPLPFCIINPSGVILNINQAFCELTGYNDLEIVGETIDRFFKDFKEMQALREAVLKKGLVKGEEMDLITKKKEAVTVALSSSKRQDKEGNFIGYFLAFSDITELKKLQRQLEEKVEERTKQLKDKVEEMERFNRLTVGREVKMVELKREVERLKNELAERREK